MNKIRGFVRNHLGAAIAGATTAVVLVGGLLVLTLVGGGSSSSASASFGSSTSTTLAPGSVPATPATPTPATKKQGTRGQVTAITGDTWTVMSARGAPVTVEVTASTAFGTPAAPLTASDFAVGDQILALGTRTKGTVTATRIAKAPAGAGGAGGGAGPAPTTPTTPTPPTTSAA